MFLSLSCMALKPRPVLLIKDAEDRGSLFPSPQPSRIDHLMDLPTEGEKLQHYTRQRPRPNRTCRKPPRKPHALSSYSESADKIEIEEYSRVDEGIDDFFSKKIIQEYHQSPLHVSPGAVTLSPSGSRTFKKKIGEFFALRKPRSIKSLKSEKEPGQSPIVAKSRKQSSTTTLRPLGKSGDTTEGQDADKDVTSPEIRLIDSTWTPDAARRIKPRYSREGKSQSLIILSRDDEEPFAIKQKKHEKNDGDVCNTFEHRVHSMLHRIGVTRILSSEMKKKQSKDGEIKKAGSEGDIVDNSPDSPLPSLKVRTHSLSTAERISPKIAEPLYNPTEGMQVWKNLGKEFNTEIKERYMELHSSPRRPLVNIDHVETALEEKSGGSWNLPAIEQCSPVPSPSQITHLDVTSDANDSVTKGFGEEENVKPQLRLKQFQTRRAVSAHEDQLREQGYTSELDNDKIPFAQLQRSPIMKLKQQSEYFTETKCIEETQESKKSDPQKKLPESLLVMKSEGNATHIALETAQNTAIDQRTEITSNHPSTNII